jgi:uncharacterized LabA/DUF88 family protein
MTSDQHDPTPAAPGVTDNAPSSVEGSAAAKTATSRTSRRRHTTSRGRQAKEPQAAKTAKTSKVAPGSTPEMATEHAATDQSAGQSSGQSGEQVAPAAPETATAAAETTPASETSKRATTRGRRGGASRRRGSKSDVPDIQLVSVVPVVHTPETTPELAAPAETAEVEDSPTEAMTESLPAPEPLPLDAAILAHLDAMARTAEQQPPTDEAALASTTTAPPEAAIDAAQAPLPPNRYRFDRSRSAATSTQTPPRAERLTGWRATPPTLMTPPETTQPEATEEATAPESSMSSAEPVTGAEDTNAVSLEDVAEATEVPESTEPTEGIVEESAETDDQSDREGTEGTARRRRRRGRGRTAHAQDSETSENEDDETPGQAGPATRSPVPYAAPGSTVSYVRDHSASNGYIPSGEDDESGDFSPYTPAPRSRASRQAPPAPAGRAQSSQQWNVATGQQHVQEPASPFGAPEPSFAHGFGPQSSGVASPLHETPQRVRRGERAGEAPPMSANQLGAIITSAISQQTDRLLSELRRQQNPPSMTVALPAFPSTERIGVFVDVANLLYSARSQRMTIDFGRLLDFLRGNRRVIRAHAYAPTNPDPHAEQTFLAAVKGVGYRITTKNYKTFASGARKADMDLDLCMDIVRMVDSGALDTVVLVSGDSDFLPLLEYCSDHGVRVEVAAFDDAAAMILRQSCDLFISLSQVDEIRA